jgi:large subunit ribosomal protein L7/L12
MSLTSQAAARCCRQLVRSSVRISSTTYLSQRTPSRRWNSTEAQAAAPANPKITQIVDQISQLTLLETADLVASLKVGFLRVLGGIAIRSTVWHSVYLIHA